MSDRDTLLNGYHKGRDRTEAEAIAYTRRNNLSWIDIANHAAILPEYEGKVEHLLETMLGYVPQLKIHLPYAPMLRGLVAGYVAGQFSVEELDKKAEPVVRQIRNDDMERNGWAYIFAYDEKDFEAYEEELSVYKIPARERFLMYLGYAPEMQHSLHAEITLRYLFQNDGYHSEMPFGAIDHRAGTIYRYRKAIMQQGLEDARSSPIHCHSLN